MDNDIPYFQTPGTMDSTPDKYRSRSPYNKKPIFDQSPMINQQSQQIKDLILQCKSLELALDASKKSSEQLVQILHFKNSEIERLRSQENTGNEERLRFLINAMEQELSHLRSINQSPQMVSQPQKFQEELHISRMEWQRQKQQMVTEYTDLREQFQESCIKIANLSNEIERLNQLLYESEQEIHYLQHNKQDSLTITMLNQEIKLLQKENEQIKQNSNHKEELEKAKINIQSLQMTVQKLQENINYLQQDNNLLNQKCHKYEQRVGIEDQFEREYQELQEEYECLIEQVEQQKLEIQEMNIRHKAEKDQIEEKLNHQINRNIQLEQEMTTHNQDFRRLEHQLVERVREIEMIRAQNEKAVKKSTYDELKSNLDSIQQENFVKHRNYIKNLAQENISLKSKLSSANQDVERLNHNLKGKEGELQEYTDLLERRRLEVEEFSQNIENLKREINKLNAQSHQSTAEIRSLKENIKMMEIDFNNSEEQNIKYRKEIREMEMQMEQKSIDLNKQIQELDQIKMKYEASYNQMASSQMQTQTKRMSVRQSIVRRQSKLDSQPVQELSFNE